MYQGQLSRTGRERLTIMRESNDGFVIAEKDLELRGPGELLGTKQTGLLQLRLADISRDQALIPLVEDIASVVIDTPSPPQKQGVKIEPLIQRWLSHKIEYGKV